MNLLDGTPAWHWALGGLLIALVTLGMLFLTNKRLGISSGFENICSLVIRAPYLRREEITGSHRWRFPFMVGLVAGGLIASATTAGFTWTWNLGLLDQHLGLGSLGKIAWMFVGGLFIGIGTRMAGGCTSGHGIFGISNFEASGLVSTVSYMLAGMVTTNVIYRIF